MWKFILDREIEAAARFQAIQTHRATMAILRRQVCSLLIRACGHSSCTLNIFFNFVSSWFDWLSIRMSSLSCKGGAIPE